MSLLRVKNLGKQGATRIGFYEKISILYRLYTYLYHIDRTFTRIFTFKIKKNGLFVVLNNVRMSCERHKNKPTPKKTFVHKIMDRKTRDWTRDSNLRLTFWVCIKVWIDDFDKMNVQISSGRVSQGTAPMTLSKTSL